MKKSKIIILIFALIVVSFCIMFCAKIPNTINAYNLISKNYNYFNYPNTIHIYSGTYKENDGEKIFNCKLSAENAYGQKGYAYCIVFSDSIYEADSLYNSVTKSGAPDFIIDSCNDTNVNVGMLNFMISKDW